MRDGPAPGRRRRRDGGDGGGAEALEGAGLSRLAALQTATTTPARLMGAAGEIGQVRPGSWADLIVVDHNPLDDLTALGR